MATVINPPNAALVDGRNLVTPEWYRFFVKIQRNLQELEGYDDETRLLAGHPEQDAAPAAIDFALGTPPMALPASSMDEPWLIAIPRHPEAGPDILIPPCHDQVVVDGMANGLVEQTGPDRFATRAIGVASAADVLTRADGDGRYAMPGIQAIRTVSTAPTIAATDATVLVNASTAPITVSLPAASGLVGRILTFKKVDASANAVTIDPNGAELIDGAATLAIGTQYQSFTIQCDGTAWWVL